MIDSKPKNSFSGVEIPASALSAEALTGVIESFIEREGTDYGANEVSLATKVNQVRRQLENNEVVIVFDHLLESVTLMTTIQWKRLKRDSHHEGDSEPLSHSFSEQDPEQPWTQNSQPRDFDE